MRLLHTSFLELREFPTNEKPPYAILSHTWGDDEVLLRDLKRGSCEDVEGFYKIRMACKQAVVDKLDYIWVDTCCIDKSSSSELSEAINSMYAWYERAEICYTHLSDVPSTVNVGVKTSEFAKSRWFKRGWTLQELIAPANLVFFSHDWVSIGTKSTLRDELAKITGIDASIMTAEMDLESASLASKMSWASHRATTRPEDIAYCLMGIFNVNMPLLYGEGEKAFIRLQEEIIKQSEDHSLFAWNDSNAPPNAYEGLLARSPAHFASSGNIVPYCDWDSRAPFSMTNKGLRIELHLTRCQENLYIAALDCPVPPDYEKFLGIYLKRIHNRQQQYARVKPQDRCKVVERGYAETIYVCQSMPDPTARDIYPQHYLMLRRGPSIPKGYELVGFMRVSKEYPRNPMHSGISCPWVRPFPHIFKISKQAGRLAAALLFERPADRERLAILLGTGTDAAVGFEAAQMSDLKDVEELKRSFTPQLPGKITLEYHQVHVNFEPRIHAVAKYFMLDIRIKSLSSTPKAANAVTQSIPSEATPSNCNSPLDTRFRNFKLKFKLHRR